MALFKKNLKRSDTEYTKVCSEIKGVDFSGKSGLADGRAPYIENMYRDYERDGDLILESVPGYREVRRFGGRINGLFLQSVSQSEEFIIVHSANGLYRFSVSERDSVNSPKKIATLNNTRSRAFSHGGHIYVMDGERIIAVDAEGKAIELGTEGDGLAYIPTTYLNGKELEQRNLLTDRFKEEYEAEGLYGFEYGSEGIRYFITDRNSLTCSVTGVDESFSGRLYIPSSVKIGEKFYSVTEIASSAFRGNPSIDGVVASEGLKRIGSFAFAECGGLKMAALPDSLTFIGVGAFSGCEGLGEVYFGSGLSHVGGDAFGGCDGLLGLHYPGDSESFSHIEGCEELAERTVAHSRYLPLKVRLPILTGASAVTSLTVGGEFFPFSEVRNDGIVTAIDFEIPDRYSALGKRISAECIFIGKRQKPSEYGEELCELITEGTDSGFIKGCTGAVAFDGRIFLYGHPKKPNTVFFSTTATGGKLYFGALDFFSDGTEDYPITSILGAHDTLAILKRGDDGNGSIFYHTPEDTKSTPRPRTYPTAYVHRGVRAEGDSAIFLDDPVFISNRGICALERRGESISREVVCRSHNVNARLLSEDPSTIRFAVWCGYLAVAAEHRIYLADSRQLFTHESGEREYEWFFMNGVGDDCYDNCSFRFHSIPYSGLSVHENADAPVPDDYSVSFKLASDGYPSTYVYMAIKDKVRYHAYPTVERKKSTSSPITEMISTKDLLFFGCKNGTVCVFNNDKRSLPPERLCENDPELDKEEYALHAKRGIHPDFYHFNRTAARYEIRTGLDECGLPGLAKRTLPSSVCVKLACYPGSEAVITSRTSGEVAWGDGKVNSTLFSFTDMHFGKLSFNTEDEKTFVRSDRGAPWGEKEICVFSEEFCSPLGIHSISYRYKISGRIKN